jgi:hypothetical protein
MTLAQLQEWVARFSYKPDHTFTVWDELDGRVALCVVASKLPDAMGRRELLELRYHKQFFWYELTTEAEVTEAVIQLCTSYERHELFEWLRYQGQHVRNPHVIPQSETPASRA